VTDRPYVLLSAAMSIDGYIDDASGARLVLSNDADFDRVDGLRAGCDAILVGLGTIRRDDPRLLVRSQARRDARVARGLPASPAKVTLTASGDVDPACEFFAAGDVEKIVYCAPPAVDKARDRLGGVATVVDAGTLLGQGAGEGSRIRLPGVLAELSGRGVRRLLVEGGAGIHTQFLTGGLADELHLVIAPFFVGDSRAPRFVGDGVFPWTSGHRARLVQVRRMDDVVLLHYALSDRFGAT
jgi:riboflavin-specific deaminase-like protein